jgi:hypothetical protein
MLQERESSENGEKYLQTTYLIRDLFLGYVKIVYHEKRKMK